MFHDTRLLQNISWPALLRPRKQFFFPYFSTFQKKDKDFLSRYVVRSQINCLLQRAITYYTRKLYKQNISWYSSSWGIQDVVCTPGRTQSGALLSSYCQVHSFNNYRKNILSISFVNAAPSLVGRYQLVATYITKMW